MKHALVLGGGGPAAAAFEIGIVAGLADGGIGVREAELFIGTSAGARVAVMLAGATSLAELYRRQVAPATVSPHGGADITQWRQRVIAAKQAGGSASEILMRMGELARSVPSDGETARQRRAEIAAQLGASDWPARRVLAVAVEVESGTRRAFERTSAVALVDAVAASGALPGVYASVEIEARHYMDGGMYSTDNADLAADCDRVLVIALRAGEPRLPLVGIEDTMGGLAHVELIQPDQASQATLAAFGGNVLDPRVAPAMARAARTQGQRIARRIAVFWRAEHAA